ncbi:UNVERIFIED_CONTAM: hypothetical protein Slati_4096500 [Sesamum latifolium]|uniref:Uncharacterized protein n=1 Tax=Sesamum latifolium TaxID=2727402 RepID=A0AAW2TAL4_9LAMI
MLTLHLPLHRLPNRNHTSLRPHHHEDQSPQVPHHRRLVRHLRVLFRRRQPVVQHTDDRPGQRKNTNFGQYKFEDTNVAFYYNGAVVGTAFIPGSSAKARSTKRLITVVELSSAGSQNGAQLGSDLSSGCWR